MQICADFRRNMSMDEPCVGVVLHADTDSGPSDKVERLVVDQEVDERIEPGLDGTCGKGGVETPAAHADFGRNREVGLTCDAETLPKPPADTQTGRIRVTVRDLEGLVIAAEREDEVSYVSLVGVRCVEPVVESKASPGMAVGVQDVRIRRKLGFSFEDTVVKVGKHGNSQFDMCVF